MEEMVVCLTAFALREESSASWSGGLVEHCGLAWGLPAAEGAASELDGEGKVKVRFCPAGERGGSGSWLASTLPRQEPETPYSLGC